jgi:ankyrin repeat protein
MSWFPMQYRILISAICFAGVAAAADTRLADAVEQGDLSAVRALLQEKVDVNAAQGDGTTALHWAAFKDDLDTAKLLINSGAKVTAATRVGAITPLFMACRNGSGPMIELLLKAGANANSSTSEGTTALMMAASSGSPDGIRVLLDHGADVNAKEAAHGQTALMFAAALNRDAAIRMLLTHGADPNATSMVVRLARTRFTDDGNPVPEPEPGAPKPDANRVETPRSSGGKPEEKPMPRERGASVMGGQTALLYAARDGQLDAARALAEGGADINRVSAEEKISPLVMAIMNGHFDVAMYLLNRGADPNRASDLGLAALYATIDVQWAPYAWFPQPLTGQERVTHLELMRALLDHGANPNARLAKKLWMRSFGERTWVDPVGATPFWRAAQSNDVPAMKLLVAAGADPKITTNAGDTALMVAAGLGWAPNNTTVVPDSWMAAVKYCLELGIDVNAVDNKGYTALHGVAFRGDNEMINFLITKGAKIDAITKEGDSIADMANGPIPHSIPHPDTVALLEKLGSSNHHNCRSDQCLVAPKEDKQKN